MKKILIGIFLFAGSVSFAQQPPAPKELSAEQKKEVIDIVAEKLSKNYILPEPAKKYGEFLKTRLKSGAYDQIVFANVFADSLKADLYKVYRDKHLNVSYNPGMEQMLTNQKSNGQQSNGPSPAMEKKFNAGFKNLSIRQGNIGYVRLDGFFPDTEVNKKVVDQAFGFLSGVDAIIIDLRYNGGGSPEMVQYISNYLFSQPTHLNSLYERDKDTTVHYWTSVVTPNLANVPVYVLTSHNTFSGAEEFSYNLKNLKRAVIIGETTRGGAHPVRPFASAHGIIVNIPFAKAINPISKTNWEGSGVSPDVNVSAYQALDVAYAKALEQLADINKGKPMENFYKWHATRVTAMMNKTQPATASLEKIAGKYGPVTIEFKGGQLLFTRNEFATHALIPLSENQVLIEGIENQMLELVRNSDGSVAELKINYENGKHELFKREAKIAKTF